MNKIRILIPTNVLPNQKNNRIRYVTSVLNSLKKNYSITPEIIWFVYQPDEIKENSSIRDIHKFTNAKDLLHELKPDLVMVSGGEEPINFSVSLAASFFKIPLVAFEGSIPSNNLSNEIRAYSNSKQDVRKFFSDRIPTDSQVQKKFLRRIKFLCFKHSFLDKTATALFDDPPIKHSFLNYFFHFKFRKPYPPNKLPDLVFVTSESIKKWFLANGLKDEQLKVVGNPLLEKFSNKIQVQKNNYHTNKIKLLIVTVPIFEHGDWSENERKKFLKNLFVQLNDKSISFSLKIHPASENKLFYNQLLDELGIITTIYQEDELMDVVNNFDLVLSYEWSQAHTEIAYSGSKMILINIGNKMRAPLVKEGIESGHVIERFTTDNLINTIKNFVNQKIILTEDFLKKRKILFPILNGKPSDIVASEILNLVSKNERS